MKKVIAIMLALLMTAALCACSGNTPGKPQGDKTAAPDVQPGSTSVPGGSDETAAPGEDPTPSGAEPEPVAGSEGLRIKEYDDSCIIADIGTFSGTELIVPSHYNGKPVTSIDEDALSNDTMTSLFIPWTIRSIGEDAVSGSQKLETVTFSEGLLGIGYGAFGSCFSLKSVTLPSTLERVGNSAFRECTALEEVTITGNPDIGNNAFLSCSSLKKVTFTGNLGTVYSLKNSAFEFDASLEEVVFAEGLETIGAFSFSGCSSLGRIVLPASLKKIEASAFYDTGSLKVFYAGSEDQWKSVEIASGNDTLKSAEITYDYK